MTDGVIIFLITQTVAFIIAIFKIYVQVTVKMRELELRVEQNEQKDNIIFKKLDNIVLVIGKTEGHIDQSLFARNILDEKNGPPPEINLFNEKNNGETLLKLINSGLIKSAHDVSVGGIITAVSKMCIKGNKGINLKKPKYLINEIEYYFAEDQGRYIIEVSKNSLKKVTDILVKNAVHFDELGTINEDQLFINEKTKVTIDELRTSNTNWLTNYMSK